jgi:DNA-binding IclR family transcriptional regulator
LEIHSHTLRIEFPNMGRIRNHPHMHNAAPSEQGQSVATSERSLMVLCVIARHGKPLTVRKLIDITGFPQSTVYRHLLTLKKWGLVQEQDNFYMPGPVSVQLAWGFDHTSYLLSNARAEMARLVAECGESVGLMVAVNDQVTCLEMVESEQSLRCSFSKGRSHPLTRGASAKAVLAHLPTADSIVDKQLGSNKKDIQRLHAELAAIRTQGYATSEGEVDWGVWGISAPIFYRPGHAAGAITLMAPAVRAEGRHRQFIASTVRTAAAISERLALF